MTQRLALKDRVRFPTSEEEEEEEEEEGAGGRALGVGAKVKVLALERLWANKGVTRRWQEVYRTTPSPQHPQFYDDATEDETRADTLLRKALALMAHPAHLGPSLAELARLSDEIWFLAGDTGVDGGWYGKRAGLAAVYASAELFMTQDGSRDFVETGRFLERRLGDVSGVGRGVGSLAQWVGFTGGAVVNGLRSKGVRI